MMSGASDLWARALDALRVARHDLTISFDASASRAYYAAFYAVSAYFAAEDKIYSKHTAVEAAVHRDLVRIGRWSDELGRGYSRLSQLRTRGDYGGGHHVSQADAEEAIQIAEKILEAVSLLDPEQFRF